MTTLMSLVPISRMPSKPRCNRIVLRHICKRTLSQLTASRRKLLSNSVVMSAHKMNSYTTDKFLTLQNMNQAVIKMEYAVRGPLVIRAVQLQKELREKVRQVLFVFRATVCGTSKR